jgi:hypothetical protein
MSSYSNAELIAEARAWRERARDTNSVIYIGRLAAALEAAEARAVEAEQELRAQRHSYLIQEQERLTAVRQLAAARGWLNKYRDALWNDDGAVAGGLLKELAAALAPAPAPVSGFNEPEPHVPQYPPHVVPTWKGQSDE